MDLAIFDVDGTLTRTTQLDGTCFVRAVAAVIGEVPFSTDWRDYTHITDSGITAQIFRDQLGRAPHDQEMIDVQQRFMDLLVESLAAHSAPSLQVPGAADALTRLRERGWAVAIATGSWRGCALLKLATAGIAIDGLPAAFADDAVARAQILRTATARSCAAYAQTRFDRVVSIGDGVWDVHAARELDLPFVGLRADGRVAALRERGVTHVLTDFTDFDALVRALLDAQVPAGEGGEPTSSR